MWKWNGAHNSNMNKLKAETDIFKKGRRKMKV